MSGRAALHPALLVHGPAVAVLLWLLAEDAGFPLRRWAPAALLVLALLVLAATGLPRPRRPERPVAVALAAFAAFTAWSFVSVLWASIPGEAWTGACRTLAYLALFALAALWAPEGRAALLVVGGLVAGIGVLLLGTLLDLGAADFVGTRLAAPAGYPNAAAALALLTAWPALVLASRAAVPWPARAAAAAAAVLALGVALLAESRGALVATPVVLLVVLAALPGRVRLLTALAVAGTALAWAAPVLLDVSRAVRDAGGVPGGARFDAAVDDATGRLLVAALGAAIVTGAWGLAEARRAGGPRGAAAAHRAGAVLAAGGAVVLLMAVLAADPAERARSAWTSFKGGYAEGVQTGSRLTSGLGSDRYDFYRVALDAFAAAPVRGEGTEQFRERYLRDGRGTETPRHPHSLPLRLLAQNGLVGFLLFGVFAGAAAFAALRRARGGSRAAAAAAAAAFAGVVSWGVHTGGDWLFEIAGLGGAAAWLLGLAVAARGRGAPPATPLARRRVEIAAVVVWALVAGAAIAGPWLADRDVARAGTTLARDPAAALARLQRAAWLHPLDAAAPSAEGTARLRLGDLDGADAAFARALARAPRDQYATLMRGAIASAQGRRADALALLRRARALAPRDDVTAAALQAARRGRIDLAALQRALLRRAA